MKELLIAGAAESPVLVVLLFYGHWPVAVAVWLIASILAFILMDWIFDQLAT